MAVIGMPSLSMKNDAKDELLQFWAPHYRDDVAALERDSKQVEIVTRNVDNFNCSHHYLSLHVLPASFAGSVCALSASPAGTPGTPRRLSLAESFTNLREGTTTTSTSLGLVRLLKERGISAAVYQSLAPGLQLPKPPTLPSTPPNSPLLPAPGPWPDARAPCGPDDPFLTSLPASSLLKELRGGDKTTRHVDSQTEVSMARIDLVAKVKRLGIGRALRDRTVDDGDRHTAATLLRDGQSPGYGHISRSPIGGLQLGAGIRRNRSLPTMVGPSMQMRGPVSEPTGILMGAALPGHPDPQ
ncbi:trafficking kinesin-binding protein 1-like [Leucoraja erinacea]|uniref:trafficking kinesin-binding protein 1-like n=1 Tax=Leucoraja erinaceus TaxID=7782 RepID=UPI002456BD2C|nr:trafficking kinesin-binding protein 1-like [Leucoraja erinacea]